MAYLGPDGEDWRVPVTVLTGFLGSGKTTLLNHLLTATHGKKLAIIENEFGEVGIDDKLLAKNTKMQVEEQILEMMNGCICCTVRQDLVVVLKKLKKRVWYGGLKLDGIIIETTGMADPAPVAQTFFVDDAIKEFARLDGIITLVDAKHIEQHLDEEKAEGAENEAVEQVAFADRLLLNKTDLVTPDDLVRVEGRLRAINALAPIERCTKSQVSADSVLNIGAFDLNRTLEMDAEFLNTDGEHVHDTSVTSLCVTESSEVNYDEMQEWITAVLLSKGKDIYRMKGIMSVSHAKEKYVYQGVHMTFDGNFEDDWDKDETRESKLVFIGKNLDREALTAGFRACISTPELREKRCKKLRFAIGDKVHINNGTSEPVVVDEVTLPLGWEQGEVVDLLYRNDEEMPPGRVAPYQVRLSSGELTFSARDADECIKKA